MQIDFAVVADYAIIDQNGKLSVLGIFSHIWVAKFPALHPRAHLVLHLKGRRTEIGQHPIKIRLLDEEETEVLTGEGTVNFSEPPAGVLEISSGSILIFDLPFKQPGRYHFEIRLDDEVLAEIPLTVAQHPTAPGATGDATP
jgi:hypothetical protein